MEHDLGRDLLLRMLTMHRFCAAGRNTATLPLRAHTMQVIYLSLCRVNSDGTEVCPGARLESSFQGLVALIPVSSRSSAVLVDARQQAFHSCASFPIAGSTFVLGKLPPTLCFLPGCLTLSHRNTWAPETHLPGAQGLGGKKAPGGSSQPSLSLRISWQKLFSLLLLVLP